MLDSSSEGLAWEGLVRAILLMALMIAGVVRVLFGSRTSADLGGVLVTVKKL
jgi:hypothetical protein